MDQQVSPAVVVIVLILILAILVGLYFLVMESRPDQEEQSPDTAVPTDAQSTPRAPAAPTPPAHVTPPPGDQTAPTPATGAPAGGQQQPPASAPQ